MGTRIIFIESFCRPFIPSVSGRLVHPIADLFITQWEQVTKHYKKAVYGGSIFDFRGCGDPSPAVQPPSEGA